MPLRGNRSELKNFSSPVHSQGTMSVWKTLWCWSGRKSWFSLTSYEISLRRDRIERHPTSFNVARNKTVHERFAVSSSRRLSLPAVKRFEDEKATIRAMIFHGLNITKAKNSLFNCALSGVRAKSIEIWGGVVKLVYKYRNARDK